MRRYLGLLIVLLMFPALAALGHDTANYQDDFGDGGYDGSDGSIDWSSTPWTEGGDDGNPGSGQVHVGNENCSNNRCLHMEPGLLKTISATRPADLSMLETAQLTFDLQIVPPALIGTQVLQVQVRGGGSGWRTLKSYVLLSEGGEHVESFDVSQYIGADFKLRFLANGLLVLGQAGEAYFDRVDIEGQLATGPTSTTSTTTTSTSSSTTSTSSATSTSSTSTTSTTRPTTTSSTVGGGSTPTQSPSSPPTGPTPALSDAAVDNTTTTTDAAEESPDTTIPAVPAGGVAGPPPGGGLRESAVGLLADYRSGMNGDLEMTPTEVLGAELTADFSMAVEVFEAAKVWIAILALGIATAVIAGVDRNREPGQSSS